jgi:hypothetical protein
MIDKAHQFAQSLADGLSRRSFLGGVSRAAALVALACGGLALSPDDAHAGAPCGLTKDGKERLCPKGQVCMDGRCKREEVKKDPPEPPK